MRFNRALVSWFLATARTWRGVVPERDEGEEFTIRPIGASYHEAKERAAAALYRYNVEKTGIDDRAPIGAELCDSSGEILGGLWGRTELGLLFLDMFFLREEARGQSQGSRLLAAVEEEARSRGCKHAVVETSSFQAPDFYVGHGYEEFGRVEFGYRGHARIFLRKKCDEVYSG